MMGLLQRIFGRNVETRAAGNYTTMAMGLREAYIAGAAGLAELTGTVQTCVSLWEGGLASADVEGTDLLDRASLAIIGRSLALRGEAVFLIREEGLFPAVDWDLSTINGKPRAYRLGIPDVGGGRTVTALAAEVLHFRVGVDPGAPWTGRSPLSRSSLTAGLLNAVESALAETYELAPIGTAIVPFPESKTKDMDAIGREFRGKRGRVLVRQSVYVESAGGPTPATDWKPQDVSPDLSKSMLPETLDRARHSILAAYGVLPALLDPNTTGPIVREAQRHLATWVLQPLGYAIAEEASRKLSAEVVIDVLRPLQAFDAGLRSRSFAQIVEALAAAKAAGLDPDQVGKALHLVDWKDDVARG
jgi:hypothetical protein